jgi:hypothetical protein
MNHIEESFSNERLFLCSQSCQTEEILPNFANETTKRTKQDNVRQQRCLGG